MIQNSVSLARASISPRRHTPQAASLLEHVALPEFPADDRPAPALYASPPGGEEYPPFLVDGDGRVIDTRNTSGIAPSEDLHRLHVELAGVPQDFTQVRGGRLRQPAPAGESPCRRVRGAAYTSPCGCLAAALVAPIRWSPPRASHS